MSRVRRRAKITVGSDHHRANCACATSGGSFKRPLNIRVPENTRAPLITTEQKAKVQQRASDPTYSVNRTAELLSSLGICRASLSMDALQPPRNAHTSPIEFSESSIPLYLLFLSDSVKGSAGRKAPPSDLARFKPTGCATRARGDSATDITSASASACRLCAPSHQ